MVMKSIVLVTHLVIVLAALQAEAQLSGLLSMININGTIFCSANGNIIPNAATPNPPFANALVQLSCGGDVVSSSITSPSGIFNIVLNPLQFLFTGILSSCNVVVAPPLVNCNASLPATGSLQSQLQFIGTSVRGLMNLINLVPMAFQLVGV